MNDGIIENSEMFIAGEKLCFESVGVKMTRK